MLHRNFAVNTINHRELKKKFSTFSSTALEKYASNNLLTIRKDFPDSHGAQKKIAAVAFDVGFNTIVAFYNAFKKYTDMTPAQYKKEAKNKK
jgi:AraC-like DNA-binding protein